MKTIWILYTIMHVYAGSAELEITYQRFEDYDGCNKAVVEETTSGDPRFFAASCNAAVVQQ